MFTAVAALVFAGCLDDVPPELQPMVDSRMPQAVSLADSAAALCVSRKNGQAPDTAISPALGTSLAVATVKR